MCVLLTYGLSRRLGFDALLLLIYRLALLGFSREAVSGWRYWGGGTWWLCDLHAVLLDFWLDLWGRLLGVWSALFLGQGWEGLRGALGRASVFSLPLQELIAIGSSNLRLLLVYWAASVVGGVLTAAVYTAVTDSGRHRAILGGVRSGTPNTNDGVVAHV